MDSRTLDNIVELRLGVLPWPLPSVEVTATLAHTFEVLGETLSCTVLCCAVQLTSSVLYEC